MNPKSTPAKSSVFAVAAIFALAALDHEASAAVLLQDNFDSYADQAAFEAVWPAGGGTVTSGTLTSAQSVSAPNSIGYSATPATQRNDRSFAESGTPSALNIIRFSIDFFDSNSAAGPQRQYASMLDGAAPSGAGQLIALGMNNNQTAANSGGNFYMARILGYVVPTTADPNGGPSESVGGSGAFFKLNDYGVGLRSTGWHNLAVEISDTEFNFFVDGVLAETVANTFTLRSYDSVRMGSGLTAGISANFDNVVVETNPVPEPGTAVLGLLGGLTLLRRRR